MNRDLAYLQHMLVSAENILTYSQNNKEYFLGSSLVKDAVVRNFQVMGEACKKVSVETTNKHVEIPWSKIAKFRDKLVHDYFGINYSLMWDVIQKELPKIVVQLSDVVSELRE